ncbi:organic cation transporter protein-like, partial [Saccoglossus kowalevskii]
NVGTGFANSWGRIAAILAPLIMLLGDYVWGPLPFLVYGSVATAAGLLVLFLPETKGVKLPETLEEGEQFTGTKKTRRKHGNESRIMTDIGVQVDISDEI